MQIAKNFVFGKDVMRSDWNNTPLDDQINEYLENHPGFIIATMSMLNGTGYKEALVVFNVREEQYDDYLIKRPEKDIRRPNKQDINSVSTKDYKNQGRINTTAHSNEKP